MSDRDLSAFLGHVVMAMDTIAEYVAGMAAESFYADRRREMPSSGTAKSSARQ